MGCAQYVPQNCPRITARSAPNAAPQPRVMQARHEGLLVAQRLDGIELGGSPGGVEAEDDADEGADDDGDEDRQWGDFGRPVDDLSDGKGGPAAQEDSGRAAEHAQRDRLDEELGEDVAALG